MKWSSSRLDETKIRSHWSLLTSVLLSPRFYSPFSRFFAPLVFSLLSLHFSSHLLFKLLSLLISSSLLSLVSCLAAFLLFVLFSSFLIPSFYSLLSYRQNHTPGRACAAKESGQNRRRNVRERSLVGSVVLTYHWLRRAVWYAFRLSGTNKASVKIAKKWEKKKESQTLTTFLILNSKFSTSTQLLALSCSFSPLSHRLFTKLCSLPPKLVFRYEKKKIENAKLLFFCLFQNSPHHLFV